jgi:hypothetical protein
MPKRSNYFQRLVLLVRNHVAAGATVTESAELIDKVTGTKREVDICIEGTVGAFQPSSASSAEPLSVRQT